MMSVDMQSIEVPRSQKKNVYRMARLLSIFMTVLFWIFNILILFPFILLRGLFRKLQGKSFFPPLEERPDANDFAMEIREKDGIGFIDANLDTLSWEEQQEFRDTMLEESDFALFAGRVKHAYDSRTVSELDSCPRCRAATRQMYANFVYGTQKGMRALWAPAGYFCENCPTAILDQDFIRDGVSKGFTFQGVLGLSNPQSDAFEPFSTWNGKKSLYIMDEDGGNVELTNINDAPEGALAYRPPHAYDLPSKERREKISRRKKHEKKARHKKRRRKK